jgi:hypothetical protein
MKFLGTSWIAASLLLAAACIAPSPSGAPLIGAGRFPPFPASVASASIEARAAFRLDHAETFGADLLRDANVIPIEVSLASRQAAIGFEPADCRLVLPDGCVLRPCDPSSIPARTKFTLERIASRAVAPAQLAPGQEFARRSLFFALEPNSELHARDLEVLHLWGDVVRLLDLSRALLVLPLHSGDKLERVCVGIGVEGAPHAARASVAMSVRPVRERGAKARDATGSRLAELERELAQIDPSRRETALRMFTVAFEAVQEHAAALGGSDDVPHLVAISMYADVARSAASAETTGSIAGEVAQELERLDWLELAAHARLGFESSAAEFLARRGGSSDFPSTSKAVDDAALPPALEPWAFVALFRFERARDERLAMRLAATALDRGADRAGELSELERWLEHDSTLEFHCPKCDCALVASLRACPSDQTPNAEFVARPRER